MYAEREGQALLITPYNERDIDLLTEWGAYKDDNKNCYILTFTDKNARLLRKYGAILDENLEWLSIPNTKWDKYTGIELETKRPALNHQKIGVQLLLTQRKFMLAWEMGCGKSFAAINAANDLIAKDIVDNVLVITDATLVTTWVRQLIPEDSDYDAIELLGTKQSRLNALHYASRNGFKFFVVNYDGLRVLAKELKNILSPRTIIIFDESQRLKDINTARFSAITKVLDTLEPLYIWCLTGTPITQHLEDIFGQYLLMSPEVYGTRWLDFKATYTITDSYTRQVTYKNLDKFIPKLHSKMHRVTKEEVLDLPDKVYEQIYFDLPDKIRKIYNDFIGLKDKKTRGILSITGHPKTNEFGNIIEVDHPLAIIAKARTICNNFVYPQILDYDQQAEEDIHTDEYIKLFDGIENPKLQFIEQLLDDTDKQLVIWFAFKADRKELELLLMRKGIPFGAIYGGVPVVKRHEIVSDFQKGKARVFLGQPRAAGTGITLTACDTVVYYTNDYSVQARVQSEDRNHRIGTKNKVLYYDLIYKNTFENSIYQMIKRKIEITGFIMDKKNEDKYASLLNGLFNF